MKNFRAQDMPGYSKGGILEASAEEQTNETGEPEPVLPPEPVVEPVPRGSGKEVLDWVDGDKEKASRARDAEQTYEEPRKTLLRALAKLLNDEDE